MRCLRIVGLALEGLRRAPHRVALTTLGVTIASAALVSMVACALGIQREVETPFRLLALLNNIQVMPEEDEKSPPLDDEAIARLERVPGVAAAYPEIRVKGLKIRRGEKTETGLALAIPREAALFGVAEELIIAGRFFDEGQQRETILGQQLVKDLGFASPQDALGAKLTLEASGLASEDAKSFTFERSDLTVTVVGVYEPPPLMPPVARRAILLPVELMKQIPGVQFEAVLRRLKAGGNAKAAGYTSATVRVADPAEIGPVESRIQAMGFQTRSVLSRLQGMRAFFLFLDVLLAALGTVALTVAALGIVNTLLMSVLERYQEIGVYKAVGASDGDVFVLFLTEAALIGLVGGLCGLVLGWGVSCGLEYAANVYARSQGVSEHLGLFTFPFWLLAATTAFAVVVSVLSGVYPALRAARVDPIRALRRE